MITQAQLRALLHYNRTTGVFTRRVDVPGGGKKGDVAGSPHKAGYLTVMIAKRNYLLHRLAWLYVKGEFPPFDIDHRDGVRSNNVWKNLRRATRSQNNQNMAQRCDNTSGMPGVCKVGNRWRARITEHGRHHHGGYHGTFEEACSAAARLKAEVHKFQPTHRA